MTYLNHFFKVGSSFLFPKEVQPVDFGIFFPQIVLDLAEDADQSLQILLRDVAAHAFVNGGIILLGAGEQRFALGSEADTVRTGVALLLLAGDEAVALHFLQRDGDRGGADLEGAGDIGLGGGRLAACQIHHDQKLAAMQAAFLHGSFGGGAMQTVGGGEQVDGSLSELSFRVFHGISFLYFV